MARSKLFKPVAEDGGNAAIELAFTLPLLAMLLAGVVDLGRALWQHQAAVKAARDAVRYLTRVPEPWDSAFYEEIAENLARTGSQDGTAPLLAKNIQADFTYPTAAAGSGHHGSDRMIEGVIQYDFVPLTGFGFLPEVTLQAGHVERYIGE